MSSIAGEVHEKWKKTHEKDKMREAKIEKSHNKKNWGTIFEYCNKVVHEEYKQVWEERQKHSINTGKKYKKDGTQNAEESISKYKTCQQNEHRLMP